ncbi:DUF6233 domain-containing protein [Streptomyces griseoincarnatus]|uniref:DUF6233 domain-containing protein n=1 Tax=Streptomyces TaxID=1883 RepID=UPI001FFD811F|nr:DUF6233 domain-containing protein [Streptomyces sp. RK31]
MWLQRIDAKIAALARRQTEEERGRRNRSAPPEWIIELGIGERRPPLQIHTGDCHMAGKRHRPVDRVEARRLLATGLKACGHCRPDSLLGITELSSNPASLPPLHANHTRTIRSILYFRGDMHLSPRNRARHDGPCSRGSAGGSCSGLMSSRTRRYRTGCR